MQTFLPYSDFSKSAGVLDRARLGKQRVETWQIYLALTNPEYGWKNHPATKMWRGYVGALLEYGQVICQEWISRGYKDTLLNKFQNAKTSGNVFSLEMPFWLGDVAFHASHRANLLRKFPEHYNKFNWTDSPTLPYVWPVT
jgi:hypothetical protein